MSEARRVPATGGEPDRRRERRAVAMRGNVIRAGGLAVQIEVVDLNHGGCGISLASGSLSPDEKVMLSVLGRGSMPALVRWCEGGRAGLDFEAAADETRYVERAADRIDLEGEISLRAAGQNAYRVKMLDLSSEGCKVELVERPRVGDQMRVKFDGLDMVEADVCWVHGHVAGLKFEQRIHPAVLSLLIARLNGW